MSERSESELERLMVSNAERIFILAGFMGLAIAALGIHAEAYVESIPVALLGAWLLGGWPAVRRLVKHPRMQLTHWYHILRDTRRVRIDEWPDGSKNVSIMRPTRRYGWYWTEERRNPRE